MGEKIIYALQVPEWDERGKSLNKRGEREREGGREGGGRDGLRERERERERERREVLGITGNSPD